MRTGGRPAVTDHRSRSTEDVGKIFFPTPISTENMSLSPTVMDVIDVLSENLHEVWSVNKIDAGWTYGPSRDDTAKTTPCLTHYAELTDVDRNYDITLTVETIKTLKALGHEPHPVDGLRKLPVVELPESYRQSTGYKPAPFDLSALKVDHELEKLIDALAANLHDIWAKNRINEGWKFGHSEDNQCKRSPNLVPYEKVDWTLKKANRDSVQTIIKSLVAFGCKFCASGTSSVAAVDHLASRSGSKAGSRLQ